MTRSATLVPISFRRATTRDVPALLDVRRDAAIALAERFGPGRWSAEPTQRGVLVGLNQSYVIVARRGTACVGTCRLSPKRPWAIDASYFTPVDRAVYLTDMAVSPDCQAQGVGRLMLEEAARVARLWPADAIRLDAYDAPAGAGGFYARSGYRSAGATVYRGVPLRYFEQLLGPAEKAPEQAPEPEPTPVSPAS